MVQQEVFNETHQVTEETFAWKFEQAVNACSCILSSVSKARGATDRVLGRAVDTAWQMVRQGSVHEPRKGWVVAPPGEIITQARAVKAELKGLITQLNKILFVLQTVCDDLALAEAAVNSVNNANTSVSRET